MTSHLRSTSLAVLGTTMVLLQPLCTVAAIETTSSGNIQTEASWTALKNMINKAENDISLQRIEIGAIKTCSSKGMVYAPNDTAKDAQGCINVKTSIPACGAGQVLTGNGKALMCTTPATPTFSPQVFTVSKQAPGKVDAYQIDVQCPAGSVRVACGGSRHYNNADNCGEDDCGFIGIVPYGANGCQTGADGDKIDIPIVYAYCMKVQ